MTTHQPASADLTVCETEPICFPGSVQPHGALLVVDSHSGLIEAASESCDRVLGMAAGSLLGRPLDTVLQASSAAQLLVDHPTPSGRLADVSQPGRPLVARASRSPQDRWLIDIEPGVPEAAAVQQRCRDLARAWRRLDDEAELAQAAASGIRALTGHDRVMVYRFDADWNGEVLGEDHAAGLEPFLGLHYPASDIPRQAREPFVQAWVRLIADVDAAPVALRARGDARQVDLGLSSPRSLSPLHIAATWACEPRGVDGRANARYGRDGGHPAHPPADQRSPRARDRADGQRLRRRSGALLGRAAALAASNYQLRPSRLDGHT